MAKRRSSRKLKEEMQELTTALYNNGAAQIEGSSKKKWTKHDIRPIKPLTKTQEDFFHAFYNGKQICACGSAGSGKSFLSIYLALHDVVDGRKQNKIILVRSSVTGRDQGFLPGTQEEKNAPFENPYRDILANLCGRNSTYDDMKTAGIIQFMTTSHLRGLTWDNAVIIVDEVQNLNFSEISTIITRLGENSRLIILGDFNQNDLIRKKDDKSGFHEMMKVIQKMPSFETIKFTINDIVRSKFVREWIVACEETGIVA